MPATTKKILVGKVVRPHGVQGEIKVVPAPEYADAIEGLTRVYLGKETTARRVLMCRLHQGAALIKLDGLLTRNDAEAQRGVPVFADAKDLPKQDVGQFYAHDLIGLRVVRESGEELGELVEVIVTGSNDVYVVQQDQRELLLPAIESCVKLIDLESGIMRVVVPEGLE
jgi:16S rRNA processing protein RimM